MTDTTSPFNFNSGPPLPAPWCGLCGRSLGAYGDSCLCWEMDEDQRGADLRALRLAVERARAVFVDWLGSDELHRNFAKELLAALDGDAPKETT